MEMETLGSTTTTGFRLPVGVKFVPTDHHLVAYFLRTRIATGHDFRSDFVAEFPDFYGKEPWVVWQMYGGGDSEEDDNEEKTLYFFTHRKRLHPNSKRLDRKVGSGTWSAQNRKPVCHYKDHGVVIGIKRDFRFEKGCDSDQSRSWLMREYQMVEDDSDVVLCTLKKSPREGPSVVEMKKINEKKRKTANVDQPQKSKQKKQKNDVEVQQGTIDCYVRMQVIHQQLHIVRLTRAAMIHVIKFLKILAGEMVSCCVLWSITTFQIKVGLMPKGAIKRGD